MADPHDIAQVPDRYLQRSLPARLPGKAMVCTAAQDMREAKPAADYHLTHGVNLTGTWSSSEDRHHWLHINQAGVWIECLLVQVGTSGRTPWRTRQLSGYAHASDPHSYVLCDGADRAAIVGFFNKTKDKSTWELSIHEPKKKFIGGFDRDGQADTKPVFLPHAVADLPESFLLQHWARPTPGEMGRMREKLRALEEPIRRYYELKVISESIADKREYERRVVALDAAVGEALPERRDPDDLPWVPFHPRTELFHTEAKRLLESWQLTIDGSTQSYLTWMQRIAQEAQPSGTSFLKPRLPNLTLRLGIERVTKIEYEAELVFATQSKKAYLIFEGKAMEGVLTLRRTTEPKWEAHYPILLGGAGIAVTSGETVLVTTTGTGWSAGIWMPEDIPGTCMMLDLGFSLGFKTRGETGLAINGPRWQNRTLNIDLSGWTTNVGAEIGPNFTASWGVIGPRVAGKDDPIPKEMEEALTPKLAERDEHVANVVHFECGSALLNDEGRDVVRRMCARDLPVFVHSKTRVEITGHADKLDFEAKNETLSELRAKNTKQALYDTLWTRMKAFDAVVAEGKGEAEHRAYCKEHGLDEQSNAAFRRVDIEVDGKVVVRLQGG